MKRTAKIIAGITALVLSFGMVACDKNSGATYPDFINGETPPVSEDTSEKYVVNVLAEGGLPLNNVRVIVKKNGDTVKRVISSEGKIELALPLGEYDLEIDESTLPAGYELPAQSYKTNAESREEITIRVPSRLLNANESCGYRVGDMMRDFSFKDYGGETYRLSEVLSTKKAVILNFWYINCPNCDSEFPAVQRAYANRSSDIEIFAINPYDDAESGEKYKAEKELTFPMGEDRLGLTSSFNVEGFPTTIVIDKYGLIAAAHSGGQPDMSYWINLFNIYTSPDYVQNITTGGDNNGNQSRPEAEKPNVTMPNTVAMANAANGDGFKATYRADENEYSWPWLVGEDENGGSYVYSSNAGKGNSNAILYADFDMKQGDVLSFEYNVDSEANRDILMVLVDGILINGVDGWSATDGWQTANVYVADRDKTVELAFVFQKDAADPDNFNKKDMAMVRDIHLTDESVFATSPIDVMRTAASGEIVGNKYSNYITAVKGSDGFYHKDTADGALIYISLSNVTPWSELHTGSIHQGEEESYYNTLYYMTFYQYATSTESSFNVTIGGKDLTDTIIQNWSIQSYMPEPYYLLPVTDELYEWATEFIKAYEKTHGTVHDNEWLEFCYYFDHYGATSHGDDKDGNEIPCEKYYDRTRGLTRANCYHAYELDDANLSSAETYNPETGRLIAEMNFAMQPHNGVYFKFTPDKTGVYEIRSYTDKHASQNAGPAIAVYSETGALLGSADNVRNHDAKKGVAYQGFVYYYEATANETVYLYVETTPATTGYYEFTIDYIDTSFEVMYIASTADGAWGGNNGDNYAGIAVAYDTETRCYYKADASGEPLLDQPVYIDFMGESCLYSNIDGCTFKPLSWLIDGRYFANLENGMALQAAMETMRTTSVDGKEPEDEYYGLVKASDGLVEALNKFIDKYIDGGRGRGNGWLMFACYMEKFGN